MGSAIVAGVLIPLCFLCLHLAEHSRERQFKRKYPVCPEKRWTEKSALQEIPAYYTLAMKRCIERDFGIDGWDIIAPEMTIGQLTAEAEADNLCPYIAQLAHHIMNIPDDTDPTPKQKSKFNKMTVFEVIALAYQLGIEIPESNS